MNTRLAALSTIVLVAAAFYTAVLFTIWFLVEQRWPSLAVNATASP